CTLPYHHPDLSSPHYTRPSLLSAPLLSFFFTDTPPTEIYTLSLHDALPIWFSSQMPATTRAATAPIPVTTSSQRAAAETVSCWRSEEHTSELQSRENLVCRLLLEKKKKQIKGGCPRISK